MASLFRLSCSPASFFSSEHTVPYLRCSFPYHRQSLSLAQLPTHSRSITIGTIRLSSIAPLHFATVTQGPVSANDSYLAEEEKEEFSNTRVLAMNIPWTSTAEDIRALFEKFGNVVDVEEYEGRVLTMKYAKTKKKKTTSSTTPVFLNMAPTFCLFVSNLPFEAKEKDVKEFFVAGGANVVYAEIIYHTNPRKSSGYGFVAFKTKKEAEDALLAFQDKELMGRPLRVARSKQFVRPPRSQANGTSTVISAAEEEEADNTAEDTIQ
ncbi:29 kDa ribonucleoprotein A, chloroplastic [Linum perenne]